MLALHIVPAQQPKEVEAVRSLLWEYGVQRNFDAALGDYETELAALPGKYAPPTGCLLLARWNEEAAGCVAFQALSPQICEMKRMFVRTAFRGKGIGKQLVQALIVRAQAAQYERMRLDTHPSMLAAAHLYQQLGFVEIERYNHNPTPGIRFFELAW